MALEYREQSLPPPLSRYVECVWFLRAGAPDAASPPERILPDGCPELILQLESRCFASRADGAFARQPPSFVAGPLTGPLRLRPEGPGFHGGRPVPARRPFALPVPASRPPDRPDQDLKDLFGPDARFFEEEVRESRGDGARREAIARFLTRRLTAFPPPGAAEHAVRRTIAARGRVSVSSLAREGGLSLRQLERVVLSRTGLTPRRLARIARFQSVFGALAKGPSDWVGVALDSGYYDQAHLIRDFGRLAGVSPAALLRQPGAFQSAFASPDRLERFFANG